MELDLPDILNRPGVAITIKDGPSSKYSSSQFLHERVAITIKDGPSSKYSSSQFLHQKFLVYFTFLYLLGVLFMDLLLVLRVRIIDKNHQSPFEIDALFMIMCIVAVFVVVLTSLIMIPTYYYKHISLAMDIHYTILTSIGGFFAILAPFSLVMVLYVPLNHFWIRFQLVCVFLAIVVAFFYLWNCFLWCVEDSLLQENKSDGGFPKIYFIGLLVPLSLVLVLFIPSNNFNFIVFPAIHLYFWIVPVYVVVTCSLYMISSSRQRGNLK